MDTLIKYALSFVGTRYLWGGNNAIEGFDCSGFVSELLKSCREIPHKSDFNAQQIYDFILKNSQKGLIESGSIVFYGKNDQSISHVAFCISDQLMIEAGGGDSTTIDEKSASAKNAVVRIRPVMYRNDFLSCLKPVYYKLETKK